MSDQNKNSVALGTQTDKMNEMVENCCALSQEKNETHAVRLFGKSL